MEKIENPEVRKYLMKFVSETLEECKLFTKVFGKGYAQKRLDINLKKVYTNKYNNFFIGYYNYDDKSITLCTQNRNEPKLSPEVLDKREETLAAILHESIHAIFNRTEKEKRAYKINNGTGMLEGLKSGLEIGRGLNEGLTNWICEKAGYPNLYYEEITNFVKQLELALGEKKVMKLGKGDTQINIPKILKLPKEYTYAFLSCVDEVYCIEETILLNSEKYGISYGEIKKGEDEKKHEDAIARVESLIFDYYFKKDFRKLNAKRNMPEMLFEKYSKLSEILHHRKYSEPNLEYASERFLQEFEKIKEKNNILQTTPQKESKLKKIIKKLKQKFLSKITKKENRNNIRQNQGTQVVLQKSKKQKFKETIKENIDQQPVTYENILEDTEKANKTFEEERD